MNVRTRYLVDELLAHSTEQIAEVIRALENELDSRTEHVITFDETLTFQTARCRCGWSKHAYTNADVAHASTRHLLDVIL